MGYLKLNSATDSFTRTQLIEINSRNAKQELYKASRASNDFLGRFYKLYSKYGHERFVDKLKKYTENYMPDEIQVFELHHKELNKDPKNFNFFSSLSKLRFNVLIRSFIKHISF